MTREAGAQLHAQMMTIIDHNTDSAMHLIGQGFIFLDLLVRGSGYQEKGSGKRLRDFYMKEAVSFIEQHYHEDISVEDISAFCGLDRSYFGRIFRDTMGASPQRFLMVYRMAKAQQLLKETRLSIGEIRSWSGMPISFTSPVRSRSVAVSLRGSTSSSTSSRRSSCQKPDCPCSANARLW